MRGELIDMGQAKRKREATAAAIAKRIAAGLGQDRVEYLYVLSQSPIVMDVRDGPTAIETTIVLITIAHDGQATKEPLDQFRVKFTITDAGREALENAGYVPPEASAAPVPAADRNPSEPCAKCAHWSVEAVPVPPQFAGTLGATRVVCKLFGCEPALARQNEDQCGYWGKNWERPAGITASTAPMIVEEPSFSAVPGDTHGVVASNPESGQ